MPGAPFQRNAVAEKAFHVSWDQFHRDARALAWRLSAAGRFSGVVAITRGGLVPAAIVARELDMRVIETICVASYAQEKIQGDIKKNLEKRSAGDRARRRRRPSRCRRSRRYRRDGKNRPRDLAQGACRNGLCQAAGAALRRYLHYRSIAGHLDLFPLGPRLEFSGADRRIWPRLTMLVLLCRAAANAALVSPCVRR